MSLHIQVADQVVPHLTSMPESGPHPPVRKSYLESRMGGSGAQYHRFQVRQLTDLGVNSEPQLTGEAHFHSLTPPPGKVQAWDGGPEPVTFVPTKQSSGYQD